ncbi:MAG: hypothetical protein JHC93_04665 [Parachlamydiales bacterium]|nr:hypothetical protein [Parachlamydiales bacterium]
MFNRLKYIIAALLLLSSLPLSALAWAKGKNNTFLSTQFSFYKAEHYWDMNGHRQIQNNPFLKREINLFAEYGITDASNFTLQTYFDFITQGSLNNHGFTDIEFALNTELVRYGNLNVLSFQNLLIIPGAYSPNDPLPLGYGRTGFQWGFLSGHQVLGGWQEFNFYYRHYWGYPSDQLRAEYLGSYPIYQAVSFSWMIKAEWGLKDKEPFFISDNIEVQAQYRLVKAYAGLNYKLTPTKTFEFGVYKDLWGENTGDGYELCASLWFRF